MRIIRAIVAGERDPDVLATYRDMRCHSSLETIRAALVGNDRHEHVFALTQSLELYDTYQAKMLDCDRKLEALVAALSTKGQNRCGKLARPRGEDQAGQQTHVRCQDRAVRRARRRSDRDPWLGAFTGAEADRRVRHGSEGMAKRQALHLLALPRTGQQNLRRQGAVFADTEIFQSGSGTVAAGGHDRRDGARRRSEHFTAGCPRGWAKPKAVTATARKIAVLFYNTLRHGMDYADPGADHYEEQYRNRVLANLQRRAKSLGLRVAGSSRSTLHRLFLRKSIGIFAEFRNEISLHRRSPRRLSGDGSCAACSRSRRPAIMLGDHGRRAREPSPIVACVDDIKRVHRDTHGRYGSPRIHAELKAQGHGVSRGRIERLMRRHGIRAIMARPRRARTTDSRHDFPIAPEPARTELHRLRAEPHVARRHHLHRD